MPEAHIAPVRPDHVAALVDHLERTRRVSGRGGELIYRARSADEPLAPDLADRIAASIALEVGAPGWCRVWGLRDGDAIRGHVDLNAGPLSSERHRVGLTLGVEAPLRRGGWGRRLMTAAIDFARAEGLVWIDLGVFAHNAPARALYRSLGFEERGTTPDRFRVDGQSVDDVAMTLRL